MSGPSNALGSALQTERRLSMVYLGSKLSSDHASLDSARLATDRQAAVFRRLATAQAAQDAESADARQWTRTVLNNLDTLPDRRRSIDGGDVGRQAAFDSFGETMREINSLMTSLTTLSDPTISKDARTEVALAQAREMLSQEDALLSGAIAAGTVTFAEHAQFTELVGSQRMMYASAVPDLTGSDRTQYQRIVSSPTYSRLQALEARFTNRVPPPDNQDPTRDRDAYVPPPGFGTQWKTTVSSLLTQLRGLELNATANATQRAKPIATGIFVRLALAGALGLVAVITTLVLSLWVGRSVIRELNGLRRAALELARERLPSVIRRLRLGEEVDVVAEAPPLSFSTQEIDQLGQAFNVARRTAIQGAVEEAKLRHSISEVFLNLARRNQALLHRQLSLLDAMERRIAEPEELEDLFRLDHLATRMRRHAEGLIILSGQTPGRGWRNPVPVVDVARAAAAEVEDYERVTVTTMPRISVAGPAVADLIHLLAELIENATMFSPPETTVQVTGQSVAHGFAVEVEDRGLSMDAATLALANEKLTNPPEFDLTNSAQLGLFVVSRLAQRHAIQVTLRTSPYGGTTAIVLLPEDIVVRGDQSEVGSSRLAVTRRAEDAMVPIGAIGAPSSYANGNGDTGPIPMVTGGGERPPLPQRRDLPPARRVGYDATVREEPPTGPFEAYRTDHGGGAQEAGRFDSFETTSRDPESFQRAMRENGGWSADGDTGSLPRMPREAPQGLTGRRKSVFEPIDDDPGPVTAVPGFEPTQGSKPALPRRVRQASLAPQLRDEAEPVVGTEGSDRSPEELRTMLNSIQKGWLRGRSEADQTSAQEQEDDL